MGEVVSYCPCCHSQGCPHWQRQVAAFDALRTELAQQRAAILDIDAHATAEATADGTVQAYIVSAGALHRALGLIGHSAPKCAVLPCERAARAESELAQQRAAVEALESDLAACRDDTPAPFVSYRRATLAAATRTDGQEVEIA